MSNLPIKIDPQVKTTAKIINILITIDTDAVMRENKNPSKNPDSPTAIGHQYGFMVATGTKVNKGQGTGDLEIDACVRDYICFYGTSASNNIDDAVLVYGINRFSGDQVLNEFHNNTYERIASVAGSSSSVLPPKMVNEVFWFHEASVQKAGTENYKVAFALYTRDGSGQPQLYGYYDWDPQIIVKG